MSALMRVGMVVFLGIFLGLLASCGQQDEAPVERESIGDAGRQDKPINQTDDNDDARSDRDYDEAAQSAPSNRPDDDVARDSSDRSSEPEPSDDRSTTELPPSFPLPVQEEYEVVSVQESDDDMEVVLAVPSGQAAYEYYREAIPEAGFTIDEIDQESSGDSFEGDIEFENETFSGDMDIDGTRVEMDLDRRDND
ncbi:MAG: hypothetical protein ACR2KW_11885 [Rubrobacter sp.]